MIHDLVNRAKEISASFGKQIKLLEFGRGNVLVDWLVEHRVLFPMDFSGDVSTSVGQPF